MLIRFRRCSIHGQVRLGQLRWLVGLLDVFPVARVCGVSDLDPDSLHFVKRRFTVWTTFSDFPFDCG